MERRCQDDNLRMLRMIRICASWACSKAFFCSMQPISCTQGETFDLWLSTVASEETDQGPVVQSVVNCFSGFNTGFYPGKKRATWKISTRLLNVLPSINKVDYYYYYYYYYYYNILIFFAEKM